MEGQLWSRQQVGQFDHRFCCSADAFDRPDHRFRHEQPLCGSHERGDSVAQSRGQIVDLTHTVPHQDVRQGAWYLAEVCPWFPAGTIHVAVVDPGVGTSRRLVYARIGTQHYVAPDNGLLSRLALHATG